MNVQQFHQTVNLYIKVKYLNLLKNLSSKEKKLIKT